MTTIPNLPDDLPPPPPDEFYAGLPGVLENVPDAIDAEVLADAEHGIERDDRWAIRDSQVAEWAMAKLAEAAGDNAQLLAQRDAQMERAQAWYARVSARPQRTAAFMRAHLEDYAIREREAGRGATLVLPNGEVPTRKGADPAVQIEDADTVVTWALENAPHIVDTTHKVLVSKLRTVATAKGDAAVTAEGETVPGTFVSEAGDPTANAKPY